jgi:hypothetical protein
MSSKYAWIIISDHYTIPGEESIEGVSGPKDASDELTLEAMAYGDKFRMRDGDGILYATGKISGDYDGFEPLNDYGTPSFGCTTIEFYVEDSPGSWRWNTL